MKSIPIAKTNLTEEEINSVLEPLRSGWLVQGKQVKAFESAWNSFTGSKESIAVTSCTNALELSLAALDFGPGDEAIVPAFTWISTANVVEHLGGKVIFADIDLNTFNINTNLIESLITKKTKAIIPVHLFGLSADMQKINKLATKNNLKVVEDAACGFGSKYMGKHVGTLSNAGCFSFHPRKAITTGEGGMITTNDSDLAERIRILRDHGACITDLQRHLGPQPYLLADHSEAGFNSRMTDIQAALGVSQMKRASQILEQRIKLAKRYDKAFQNLDWLQTPIHKEGFEHSYQSYPCLFEPEKVQESINDNNFKSLNLIHRERNSLMKYLQEKGISTRPATHAIHMLSFYKQKYGFNDEDFPFSFAANNCSISLPLYHGMTTNDQDYVIDVICNR